MNAVSSFFLLSGALFALIAAIGIVRLPDLYCRMHAATKAGAFGVSLMLIGLICALPNARVIIQSLMIICFFYLTAPIAAHMIGRVALQRGINMWRRTDAKEEPKPLTTRAQGLSHSSMKSEKPTSKQ